MSSPIFVLTPGSIRCMLEPYTWIERFKMVDHTRENVDSLVKEFNSEATYLFEDFCIYTRSATVQISSWSVVNGQLGVIIDRVTVRVDRHEAGFRSKKTDCLEAWINFPKLAEPLDLLRAACKKLWVIRRWPGPSNSWGSSVTSEPKLVPSNSSRWKPLSKLVKLP